MANTVTTSIVVQFTQADGTSGTLVMEVDDRATADGGLNGGKTSFMPGDTVWLLRYKSSNVVLDAQETSLGSLAEGAAVVVSKTEDVTFAGETEASVRYPITSGFTYTWVGKDNGTISVIGETTLRIPEPAAGSYAVGIAKVTYNTTATVVTLTHSDPGLPDYGIVVFVAGHTA